MSMKKRFLKLAAEITLDLFINQKRTDTAIQLIEEWLGQGTSSEVNSEILQAKHAAVDPQTLNAVVSAAIKDSKTELSEADQEIIAFTVASGVASTPGGAGEAPPTASSIRETFVPGKERITLIWIDLPTIVGNSSGRYCHFYWTGTTYRLRDYIGGNIYHPTGRNEPGNNLRPVELSMTAVEIWQASKVPIPCLKKYGLLDQAVAKTEFWKQTLQLITETAAQWTKI